MSEGRCGKRREERRDKLSGVSWRGCGAVAVGDRLVTERVALVPRSFRICSSIFAFATAFAFAFFPFSRVALKIVKARGSWTLNPAIVFAGLRPHQWNIEDDADDDGIETQDLSFSEV